MPCTLPAVAGICPVMLPHGPPQTSCMPCPCGHLEPLRLTVCSTTFPQVDRLSPRGDT